MTKYAIYARVSTALDSQATSYESQVEDLKDRVKALYPEYRLVKVYGDQGISGTKEERPVFKKMIADAIAGNFEVIITKSISRFARNIRLLLNTLQTLEDHHVAVIFLEENIDTRKTTQKFLLTVLGALAEMEAQNTREHIKESYAMKHAAGKMARPHTIAYGYRRENGETVIDAQQAEIIKQVFSWFVDDGLSRGAIAQRLNDRNIPLPRPKDGHRWHRTTILYMLKNSKYCGRPEETIDAEEKMQFEGPAIIDEATYDAAQKLLEEYSRQPKVIKMRENKSNFNPQMYPLSGLCKCAVCGGKVTRYARISTVTPGKYPLEFCDPANKGTPLWGCLRIGGAKQYGTRCKTYMISEQYLYEMIIEAIIHCFWERFINGMGDSLGSKSFVITGDSSSYATVKEMIDLPAFERNEIDFSTVGIPLYEEMVASIEQAGVSEKYNKEKADYNNKIKDIDKKMKRVKDMFEDGDITPTERRARLRALQKQKDNLIEPKTPEQVRISGEQLKRIKDYFAGAEAMTSLDEVRTALRNLFKDRELRRSLVRSLVEEIIIGGEPRFQAVIKIKGAEHPVMYNVDQRTPRRRGNYIRYDEVSYIGTVYED